MQILSKHSKCKHVTQYMYGAQAMFVSLPHTKREYTRKGWYRIRSIPDYNGEARFLYTFNYLIKYIYIQHIHSQ